MTDEEQSQQAPQQAQDHSVSEATEQRAMIKALLGSGGVQGDPNQGLVAQAAPVSGEAPPDSVQAHAQAVEPSTPAAAASPSDGDS